MKTLCILLISTFIVLFGSVEDSSANNAIIPTENDCLPAVLMLRGSNETNIGGEDVSENYVESYTPLNSNQILIETNGWESARIQGLLQSFVNDAHPTETTSKVRFIGIDDEYYPAINPIEGVGNFFDNGAAIGSLMSAARILEFKNSYQAGAAEILEQIKNDENRGCDTKYMLVGYSQGALSIRSAVDLLGDQSDKIVSSYVFGDPAHKASAVQNPTQANTATHDGYFRSGPTLALASSFANPSYVGQNTALGAYLLDLNRSDSLIYKQRIDNIEGSESRSLCHSTDIFCDSSFSLEEHGNYFSEVSTQPFSSFKDRSFESNEFDNQVKYLADSVPSTTQKPRQFTSTSPVTEEPTIYNVVNTHAGDTCSWDQDTDGFYEDQDIACNLYSITHFTNNRNVTVQVTDISNNSYTFNLSSSVAPAALVNTVPYESLMQKSAENVSSTSATIQWKSVEDDLKEKEITCLKKS